MTEQGPYAKSNYNNSLLSKSDVYGWCHTDRVGKDATKIECINGKAKRIDYFGDPEFAETTEWFMAQFGLPKPEMKDVYRGNSQDLLFLDDYELVIRPGVLDVVDLINPFVLQPLFWLPHETMEHVIALYGGVQLLSEMNLPQQHIGRLVDELTANLYKTHQNALDIQTIENIGIINGMPIVIDLENTFFGTTDPTLREEKRDLYSMYIEHGLPPHEAIAYTMDVLYAQHSEFSQWMLAYQAHQPLRAQLWDAIHHENDRTGQLSLFYDRCASLMHCPEMVRVNQEERFLNKGVTSVLSSHFTDVSMALYSPWTGDIEDNRSKPTARIPAGPKCLAV